MKIEEAVISRIEIGEKDVLLVQVQGTISQTDAVAFKARMVKMFTDVGVAAPRIIVTDSGLKFSVLSQAA